MSNALAPAGLPADPLTQPLTFTCIEQTLYERARAGLVLNLKTGRKGPMSDGYVQAVLSSLRHTLAYLWSQTDSSTGDFQHWLEATDLRPMLGSLELLASKAAAADGHLKPANQAANVRKALAILGFLDRAGRPRRDDGCIHPAFQPLHDAIDGMGALGAWRKRAGSLLCLQRVALANGAMTPEELPHDREVLEGWLADAGLKPHTIKVAISAYQTTVPLVPKQFASRYPVYPRVRSHRERHLGTLPDLVERLRACGCEESPAKISVMTPFEHLKWLAPGVAEDVEDFLKMPRSRPMKHNARLQVVTNVSRLITHAIQTSDRYADLFRTGEARLIFLLEERVDPAQDLAAPSRPRTRAMLARTGIVQQTIKIPLLMALAEREAAASRPYSPLGGGDSFWPPSVARSVETVWQIVRAVYAEMREVAPGEWRELEGQARRISDRIAGKAVGQPATRPTALRRKDKAKAIALATLPQLTCVGLPVLANHVDALESRYRTLACVAREKGHGETHPAVRVAKTEWERLLENYVIIAAPVDDGLRVANYASGWMGRSAEIRPELRIDEQGEYALARLTTRFTGTGGDNEPARLKGDVDRDGKERDRQRTVSPGVVRHDLVLAYLQGPRADRLVARGLRDRAGREVTRETYSLEAELAGEYGGPFCLFVSARSRQSDRGYTTTSLSDRFGEALHWICRHAFARHLPDFKDPALRREYRAIFAFHILRLFVATYWLGVRTDLGREGIDRAMHLTNDTEDVLRDEYVAVDHVMREARRISPDDAVLRWEHPDAYNAVMDRQYGLEVVDLTSMADLARPSHLEDGLIAPITREVLNAPIRLRRARPKRR